MKAKIIAVGIVKFEDKILLLKRTLKRHSSPNKWEAVSGYVEAAEKSERAVIREVREETGLRGKIIKTGDVFEVKDNWGLWRINPFLINVDSDAVRIDSEEHTEFAWVVPNAVGKFVCVKGMKQNLINVGLLHK